MRELNTLNTANIPPYQFWNSEFRIKQPAFIRFNFTLPWGANFAVYGRRNVAPSVTQYDFVEFVKGGRVDHRLRKRGAEETTEKEFKFLYTRAPMRTDVLDSIATSYEGTKKILADSEHRGPFYSPHDIKINYRQFEIPDFSTDLPHPTLDLGIELDEHVISKRDAATEQEQAMFVNVSLLQYLDTGRWFLSVYNDELQPHSVSLVISEAEGVSTTCPNDCSGRGSCYLGKCDCIDGFQGIDCSKSKHSPPLSLSRFPVGCPVFAFPLVNSQSWIGKWVNPLSSSCINNGKVYCRLTFPFISIVRWSSFLNNTNNARKQEPVSFEAIVHSPEY